MGGANHPGEGAGDRGGGHGDGRAGSADTGARGGSGSRVVGDGEVDVARVEMMTANPSGLGFCKI